MYHRRIDDSLYLGVDDLPEKGWTMKPIVEIKTVTFEYDSSDDGDNPVEYTAEIEVTKYTDKQYGADRDGGRSMSRVFIDDAVVISIKSGGKPVERTTELCEAALAKI